MVRGKWEAHRSQLGKEWGEEKGRPERVSLKVTGAVSLGDIWCV